VCEREKDGQKERKREGDIEGEYIGTDEEDSRLVFILQCKSFQSRTSRRANSLTVSDGFSHVEKSITAGACARVISEKKKRVNMNVMHNDRDDAADLYSFIMIAVVTLCDSIRT